MAGSWRCSTQAYIFPPFQAPRPSCSRSSAEWRAADRLNYSWARAMAHPDGDSPSWLSNRPWVVPPLLDTSFTSLLISAAPSLTRPLERRLCPRTPRPDTPESLCVRWPVRAATGIGEPAAWKPLLPIPFPRRCEVPRLRCCPTSGLFTHEALLRFQQSSRTRVIPAPVQQCHKACKMPSTSTCSQR